MGKKILDNIPRLLMSASILPVLVLIQCVPYSNASGSVQLGPRPYYLINMMPSGELRDKLLSCRGNQVEPALFSISHRGAPLQFPEHTLEGYKAAARMGAGIIECDVTFTKDKALVCRHSQCDLHTTTDILATDLAVKCSSPPDVSSSTPFAQVKCCTSDITLAEFRTLRGKMDAGNRQAKTLDEYLHSTADYRTDLYATSGTLMTHRESIDLFKSLYVKMIPELKQPEVSMPFEGFSQSDYAHALVNDYREAEIDPQNVYLQSFSLDDIKYWLENEPEFAPQVAWLDGRYNSYKFSSTDESSWEPSMQALADHGLHNLAPPIWMLLSLDKNKQIVPSVYAIAARKAGLNLITWSLERSGPLNTGGGWYYQTITEAVKNDGDMYTVLNVLAREVGVSGVFSDWPATVTYYANCMLK